MSSGTGGPSAMPDPRALELPATYESLAALRQLVIEACAGTPAAAVDGWVSAVALAAHEAACNIVRHAHGGRPGGTMWVEAVVTSGDLRVRISHDGEPFEGGEACLPDLAAHPEGGFGLYIIERSVDEVRYEPDAKGRPGVVIVKRFPPSGPTVR